MKFLIRISLIIAFGLMAITTVNAQTTRKDKNAAKVAEIKALVDSQRYVFKATYVNPTRGGGRTLTSDYDLTVTKDTLIAFLPYFGRAYLPPRDPNEGGIKFTNTKFSYDLQTKKNGSYVATMKPKVKDMGDMRDIQSMILSISTNGYASLTVISTNRDAISFSGYIEAKRR